MKRFKKWLILKLGGYLSQEVVEYRPVETETRELTACYVIPDLSKPYEQEWLGGEQLEEVLTELAETEFTEAEEVPDEGAFRAALVIATSEEQITVQFDENKRAWAFYEGRWLHERR